MPLEEPDAVLAEVSGRAAALVVPQLLEWFAPRSVVDLGCNVGLWLRAFVTLGIDDVLGFEHAPIEPGRLAIPPEKWVRFDLGEPLGVDRRFDLALCLEVAEHLPPAASELLVDELVALAPAVVFSAGVPGQGGDGHINERWGSYWEGLFGDRGLVRFDVLRHRLWDDPGVQWWYSQNMVVYAAPDHPAAARLREEEVALPIDIVHPRLFTEALARDVTSRQIVRGLPGAVRSTIRNRLPGRAASPAQ